MEGWIYLIKNGDLYKIGITRNFDNRMRQLKPDKIINKLYSKSYKQLEKELHKKYKDVRIPQSEYFRLNRFQINEIRDIFKNTYFTKPLALRNFVFTSIFILFILIIILFIFSFTTNDINTLIMRSLDCGEKISCALSIYSLIAKQNKYFDFITSLKYRLFRFSIYILWALFIRIIILFHL